MEATEIHNRVRKYRFYLLFAVGAFVALLLSIDFHIDGSSVTPGNYSIENLSSNAFGYNVNAPGQLFIVERKPDDEVAEKYFTLVYLADKQYFIEDEAGNRLTFHNGKIIMAEPSAEKSKSQRWEIRRRRISKYFTITNVESGLSLYAEGTGPLQCGSYIEDAAPFLFEFILAA